MKTEKQENSRKRKMLLVLPLFAIPFVTLAFWAMGGGKSDSSLREKRPAGLNLELPNAQLEDDKDENKLSYYEEAEKDSAKWRQGMENDPFYLRLHSDSANVNPIAYSPYPTPNDYYKDPNEQKVYEKLADLNRQLQDSKNLAGKEQSLNGPIPSEERALDRADVTRLEEMMQVVTSPNTRDPQVEQLNHMMDRILDIQHPERVKQKLDEDFSKSKGTYLFVRKNTDAFSISLLDTCKDIDQTNSFFGSDVNTRSSDQNAIEAVIDETQNLVDGSIVKIRLLNEITVDGSIIPSGNLVFGKASLQGERLHIQISTLRKNNSIFPVSLTVYDLDGMEGIHIPGAIPRDVAKTSADNSLQNLGVNAYDPSFKAQATTAGINAAKTLLARKAKLIKVTVKAGYKILIKGKPVTD